MIKTLLINTLLQIVGRLTAPGLVTLLKRLVAFAADSSMSNAEKRDYVLGIIKDQPDFQKLRSSLINLALESVVVWLKNKAG